MTDLEKLIAAGFHKAGCWIATDSADLKGIDMDTPCPRDAGVYAFVAGGTVRYVGSAQRGLHSRFRRYATTETMRTSVRVRGKILGCLLEQESVEIYTLIPPPFVWNSLPVDLIAGIEEGLIRSMRPAWNRRSNPDRARAAAESP